MNEEIVVEYCHVPVSLLGNSERSFLFDLYIYSPRGNCYQFEWKAHKKIPLTKIHHWLEMEKTGIRLAVTMKQKRIMMLELGAKEEALKVFPFLEEQDEILKIKEHVLYQRAMKIEKTKHNFDDLLKTAVTSDNYLPLIEWTQKQILAFDINVSKTVSNARMLAGLMTEDNYHLRIAALTVQYAYFMGKHSQEDLADLFCAAMLKDLGFVFLNYNFLQLKFQEINKSQQRDYWKHASMSLHLIGKSSIELSQRCLDIINHHHETPTGSGFPNGLGKHQVDPLTYTLGIVEATLQFASGRLQNNKLSLLQVLQMLREKKPIEGLLPFPIDDYALFAGFMLKSFPIAAGAQPAA